MNAFLIAASFGIFAAAAVILVKVIKLLVLAIRILTEILIRLVRLITAVKKTDNNRTCHTDKRNAGMTPEESGRIGEEDLFGKLSEIEKDGMILRNLYVPASYGTAEIDAVVITGYGIHVFEYKNYNCDLYIPQNAYNNWVRCPYGNPDRGYEIHSPVRQNSGHIRALKDTVALLSGTRGIDRYFKSYVVLGDGCNICTDTASTVGTEIMNLSCLNSLCRVTDWKMPETTMHVLCALLKGMTGVSEEMRRKHIECISIG